VELKTDGVGGVGTALQPRPLDRALAFLDALLRRTTLVVEGHDALAWPCEVGDDEAITR
jgi:hypothetical protein